MITPLHCVNPCLKKNTPALRSERTNARAERVALSRGWSEAQPSVTGPHTIMHLKDAKTTHFCANPCYEIIVGIRVLKHPPPSIVRIRVLKPPHSLEEADLWLALH